MFAVIDCGSTNTRVYLIDEDKVISKGEVHIGVQDTINSGSNQKLKDGIKEAFEVAAKEASISLQDIQYAVASGMITSEIGLMAIPHLVAPVSLEELANHVQIVNDPTIFPLPIPVVLVRGIKNDCGESHWDNIRKIDLMRGEETQAFGLLAQLAPILPINIVELGSTTKLIHIDKEGRIAGSITTLSGQVYDAVKKGTFLGGCIKDDEKSPKDSEFYSEEIVKRACDCVQKAGFLRTLLFTRFIQFTLPTTAQERKFFMESAIAADDLKIFDEAQELGFDLNTDFIIVGNKGRSRIYEALIKEKVNNQKKIISVCEKKDIEMLAVRGAIEIVKGNIHVSQLAMV